MKKTFAPLFVILFSAFVLPFPASALEDVREAPGTTEAYAGRTLTRVVEPVFVLGELLSPFLGTPLKDLRLFAFSRGEFRRIAFQVDERTHDLNWVVPQGPKGNAADGNEVLDIQDVLSFFVADAGDRAPMSRWPADHLEGMELTVVDPSDQGKGWVYLFSFAAPPPLLTCDTFDYVFDRAPTDKDLRAGLVPGEGNRLRDVVLLYDQEGEIATYIDYGGTHKISYKTLKCSPKMGGNLKDSCDTLRLRMAAKFKGGLFTLRLNEGKLRSDTACYSTGPVVGHRVTENYLPLVGGLRSPKIISDSWGGGRAEHGFWFHSPTRIKVPFRLGSVFKRANICVGSDYTPDMFGAFSLTSLTPPVLVDGHPSPQESSLKEVPIPDPRREWRIITGEPMTLLARNMIGPELARQLKGHTSMVYSDDLNESMPPEDHPGTIGCLMQRMDITGLKKGEYVLWVDYFIIPFFYELFVEEGCRVTPKVRDVIKKYTQVVDVPLRIEAGGHTAANYLEHNPMKKLK